MGLFERFYPDEYLESAYQVDYRRFYEEGYRGVIFDVDNTLVPHGAPADGRAVRLFGELHEMGMATCLLSNNKEPRVASFASRVDSPYLFKGGKPNPAGYQKAMGRMGTDVGSTLFVGDQIFTDVYGAKRAGIHSILVRPIHPKEEIQIVLKRYLEAVVLHHYRKDKERGRLS